MSVLHRALTRDALRLNADDLLNYFERRVEVRDDAADLLSETMLTVWRRVSDLPEEPQEQRMWLYGIAANTLKNHRRSARRRRALADRLRDDLRLRSAIDHEPNGASEVRAAVLKLDDQHAELVRLVHWEGFTLAEAAEILHLNPSTARSRYAVARRRLKRALSDLVPQEQTFQRADLSQDFAAPK